MNVYFDNAATTPLDEEVLEAMLPFLQGMYGNPSSTHAHGREARVAIEQARKKVAEVLGARSGEIYFTSGGTEADNIALVAAVKHHEITHIITSPMEHHAVLHTIEYLATQGIEVSYVNNDKDGVIDYAHLEELLQKKSKSMVSIMHANNETGNVNDIARIEGLCRSYEAIFHSDTVQTLGTKKFNLLETGPDMIAGSAHKFYGPKGIGLLYVRNGIKVNAIQYGGNQEKGVRAGTENTAGIIGLAKALELADIHREERINHYRTLKSRMMVSLNEQIPEITYNGTHRNDDQPNVLNVLLPESFNSSMATFQLDMQHISASGGSACGSGALQGSHVLAAMNPTEERASIRFSFGKQNTIDEVDYVVEKIVELASKQ